MKVINIHEAKAKLSEYLDAVVAGERVLICKRNQPVAELRAVAGVRTTPRPVGKAAGQVKVQSGFFDPLPDDLEAAFAGLEEPSRQARPARAAEPHREYRVKRGRRAGR